MDVSRAYEGAETVSEEVKKASEGAGRLSGREWEKITVYPYVYELYNIMYTVEPRSKALAYKAM